MSTYITRNIRLDDASNFTIKVVKEFIEHPEYEKWLGIDCTKEQAQEILDLLEGGNRLSTDHMVYLHNILTFHAQWELNEWVYQPHYRKHTTREHIKHMYSYVEAIEWYCLDIEFSY